MGQFPYRLISDQLQMAVVVVFFFGAHDTGHLKLFYHPDNCLVSVERKIPFYQKAGMAAALEQFCQYRDTVNLQIYENFQII